MRNIVRAGPRVLPFLAEDGPAPQPAAKAAESTGRLLLRLARMLTHCNLPQGDFQLLDFRRHVIGAGGLGAA